MAGLQPFNYGNVVSTGENVLNSRYARDPNNPRNQLLRQKLNQSDSRIEFGKVNPRDFTPESLAVFSKSMDWNDLNRYERFRTGKINGALHLIDVQGEQAPIPLSTTQSEAQANQDLSAGTERGKLLTQKQILPDIKGLNIQAEQQSKLGLGGYGDTTAAQVSAEKETAVGAAKETAEVTNDLSRMKSNLPMLSKTVDKLRTLAKTATYTWAGKVRDETAKQLGMNATGGAVSRAKFIALVNNQVLPLLRQTFGAAFTAQEGESLKITMGDPNSTTEEKMAQLDAFIESKVLEIEAKQTQLGDAPVPVEDFSKMTDEELNAIINQ